jgi:hypothetical protein
MRISLVPRLRPPYGRPSGGVSDEPPLDPLGKGKEVNRAILSGLLAAEPQRDKSRDGAPITVLLVLFTAPDERAHDCSTCCEVEVLDSIANRHRGRRRTGRRVWVDGQLTGDGLWATSLGTGEEARTKQR